MDRAVRSLTAAVGLSLGFLYALTLAGFARHIPLSSLTALEVGLLSSQALRVAGASLYYRTRPVRMDVLVLLFSLEAFAVSFLVGLAVASSTPAYAQVGQVVFSTWVASIFVVLPSYAMVAGLREMAGGRRLAGVLLPVGLEFGSLVFIATALFGSSAPFTLSSFFDFLAFLHGAEVPASYAALILVPSVAVYCSLLVYPAASGATGGARTRVAAALPLASAAVSLCWVYASVLFVADSFLSLTLPGLVLVVALLVYMRR